MSADAKYFCVIQIETFMLRFISMQYSTKSQTLTCFT